MCVKNFHLYKAKKLLNSTLDIIFNILSNFFSKKQITEFEELLKKSSGKEKSPQSYFPTSDKEQLNSDAGQKSIFKANIELLITFASEKLDSIKFIELLLYLGETCISRGELDTASQIFERTLASVEEFPSLENIAAYSMLALGEVFSRQAQWEKSISNINLAKKLFNKHKDLRGIAKCNNLLGTIYGDRGNFKKARSSFENSLTFLNPRTDAALIGMVEMNLGILSNMQGKHDEALFFYQRAIIKYDKLKDMRRISQLRHNLGMLHAQKGEYEEALKEFDGSIAIAMKADYLPDLALSYLSKAFVYSQLDDFPLAIAFADKSMDICYKINDRLSIADLYKVKGIVERKLKHYDMAENYFMTSLRINSELGNPLNQAETLFELGILYIEVKMKQKAVKQLKSALSLFKKMETSFMVNKINKLLATLD